MVLVCMECCFVLIYQTESTLDCVVEGIEFRVLTLLEEIRCTVAQI